MRTEEETKYDLDERIFDLYDSGLSVKSIAEKLDATADYITVVLNNVQIESI